MLNGVEGHRIVGTCAVAIPSIHLDQSPLISPSCRHKSHRSFGKTVKLVKQVSSTDS